MASRARIVALFARFVRWILLGLGAGAVALATLLLSGAPLLIDRLVIEVDDPSPAAAIVCIGGGLSGDNLPLQDVWDRIYTAVQLHADGFAPKIIFTGGGTEQISEAEVYAEAAEWLGCPKEAMVLDPVPGSTAGHPQSLLELRAPRIERDTPLLLVTSSLHSKRVALTFRKAGYSNIRVVVDYEAEGAGRSFGRRQRRSRFEAFEPSGNSYNDPFNRLKWGLDRLLTTLRELAAIAVYKYRGQA